MYRLITATTLLITSKFALCAIIRKNNNKKKKLLAIAICVSIMKIFMPCKYNEFTNQGPTARVIRKI